MTLRLAAAACVIACMLAAGASGEEIVVVPTRPGVTLALTLVAAAGTAHAAAVLFPGAEGVLAFVRGNFLLRVRADIASRGIMVAIADAPSDHRAGLDPLYRASDEAAQDIAAIIAELKRRANVPVWLVGTSNGSISAANGAVRLGPPRIAGAVLTSSVWSGGMSYVALEKIAVPVLVVHNRNDGCPSAQFVGAEQAMSRFAAAPAKELIAVSSSSSNGSSCGAFAPHGYYGIEAQVVAAIADWILAHPPEASR